MSWGGVTQFLIERSLNCGAQLPPGSQDLGC